MLAYKMEFIEFLVRAGALKFGSFVTKSGRQTPFFINTGCFDSGRKMAQLGEFYAKTLKQTMNGRVDCIFGPAYKGIPLAVATSIALFGQGFDIPYLYNRKEAKDHGEGGSLVGHKLRDGERVGIIEDVTTAGTSVRESILLLRAAANVEVVGLIVSVDRQERGQGKLSALAELREEFGIHASAIVTLDEIIEHLHNRPIDGVVVLTDEILGAINAYRVQYGAER